MNNFFCSLIYKLDDASLVSIREFVNEKKETFTKISSVTESSSVVIQNDNPVLTNNLLYNNLILKFEHLSIIILKINKNSMLHWHKDRYRGCAINIPIYDLSSSLTLFGTNAGNDYQNIIKVPYNVGCPVLLNTQESHCVLNLSNEDRYILSFGFLHPTTYLNVYEHMQMLQ